MRALLPLLFLAAPSAAADSGGAPVATCGGATTADALDAQLVGTWTGTAYDQADVTAVTLTFGPDHAFAGTAVVGESSCQELYSHGPGVAYEVLGPTLIMVTGENIYASDCGDGLQHGALHSVWISPDCTLTAFVDNQGGLLEGLPRGVLRLVKQ